MILRYDISVTGEQNVARALAGIERRFIVHNARMMRASGQRGGASAVANRRAAGPGSETKALERESRQVEAYWRRVHQRSADYKIRQDARAQRAAEKGAEKEANARVKAAERAAAAAAKAEERAVKQQEQYWRRAHQRASDQRLRLQERAVRKQTREDEKNARQAQASRRRFADSAFGVVGGSVKGTLAATGAMGGAALGLAGGFAAAGAVQSVMGESAQASRLANQAGDPGIKGQLLKEAQGVRGFTGGETLSAIEGFVTKTGDLEAARALIQDLGQLSHATGTDFGEMGEAAGQAFNVIKDTIKDPKKRLEAVNDVMRTLAAQGNLGAVEIRDMTTELAGLGAATRKFKGGPTELLKTMGAMAQTAVARGGAASAAEATTAVTRFAADLTKDPAQKELAGHGIDVFSDESRTALKSPQEIMLDILDKTKGDMPQIEKILNAESAKALAGFSPLYLEAEAQNAKLGKKDPRRLKEGESGRAAVMAEFDKFIKASVSDKEISMRADSRLSDADLQFKEILKEFNSKIGSELLPVLTRLIPQFAKLMPYVERAATVFGKMVDAFAEDPFAGLAKIVAAKLAFDVAVASLGSTAERLKNAMTSAADSVDGASQRMGKMGAAGLGLELGLATATIIVTSGIVNFEKGEAEMKSSGAALNIVREVEEKNIKGTATAADMERAKVARDLIRKNDAEAQKQTTGESIVSGLAPWILGRTAIPDDAAADAFGADVMRPSKKTEVNTQSAFSAEAEKRFTNAVNMFEKAVSKMPAGASPAPNRSNDPKIPTG